MKYLNNVWLVSDAIRHESVQKLNYSPDYRIDCPKETTQKQGNAIETPIGPTLRPNTYTGKIKKKFQRLSTKASKKRLSAK